MYLTKCNFVIIIVVLIVKINAQGPNASHPTTTSNISSTTLSTTVGKPTSINSSPTDITVPIITVSTVSLHTDKESTVSTKISPTAHTTEPTLPPSPQTTKGSTGIPSVTTSDPMTTTTGVPHHNRQFDGPSFIGGIVLATGLMAIGFVAFKFYKARTERNYHTL